MSLQVLRDHHGLSDGDMQRVYRMLRVHSLGFHHLTCEATQHARDRGTLLLSIWRAYGGLWDAALQVGVLLGQDFISPCSATLELVGMFFRRECCSTRAPCSALSLRRLRGCRSVGECVVSRMTAARWQALAKAIDSVASVCWPLGLESLPCPCADHI